jgi:hypothetical protein
VDNEKRAPVERDALSETERNSSEVY